MNSVNFIICNKCKREIDKLNSKRVFGQKNVYECKGNELQNCEEILNIEKKNEYNKKKEEANNNQKIFENEYLEYIIKNQDNYIKLPENFQYRDANVRYYDPVKKLVFKKNVHGTNKWSIDEKLSKINFEHLENSSKELNN